MNNRLLVTILLIMLSVAFNAHSQPEIVVAASNQSPVPPLAWIDHCTGEQRGYGTRRVERLALDLGFKLRRYKIDLTQPGSLDSLLSEMDKGNIDAFAALPNTFLPEKGLWREF